MNSFQVRRRRRITGCWLWLTITMAVTGCGSNAAVPSPTQGASPPPATAHATTTLRTDCTDSAPCTISAGKYVLGDVSVLAGLGLTVPAGGWRSPNNDPGGVSLVPPGHPNDQVAIWDDLTPVKSTGPGHGATVLTNLGTTADALISWITSNPDLTVVVPPAPATIGVGIKTTSLVVGVSRSARYGDPSCPSNPRCADLFTNRALWGANQFVGLVGDEEFRLYLAPILVSGQHQTLMVVLDASNNTDLAQLATDAAPIVNSLHLPADAVSS